jgi:uncharacterized protein YecE (DUF72 family)
MAFDRDILAAELARLAADGVFIGTSSWKYPGWRGMLYTDDRYIWRGRFAQSRFERQCLAEYSEVFRTVSVDAAYYQFPTDRALDDMAAQVRDDFLFVFKVTDAITLRRYPQLPRFGVRAGQVNRDFLNADLFQSAFLGPCAPHRQKTGLLIFEFARFQADDFARGREFVEALDQFLARLPRDWPYGVELRNRNFLQPEYFATLARHGVAHVFNSWEAMPPVHEQLDIVGARTAPGLCAARFLLRPGRRYEDAVKMFQPYQHVRDVFPEGRDAMARIVREGRTATGRTLVFVNNRFEGCALETIAEVVATVTASPEAASDPHAAAQAVRQSGIRSS